MRIGVDIEKIQNFIISNFIDWHIYWNPHLKFYLQLLPEAALSNKDDWWNTYYWATWTICSDLCAQVLILAAVIIFYRAIVWLYHVVPAPPAPVPCSAVCSRSRHLILLSTCCRTLCVYIPRLEPDSRLKLLSILWAAVHFRGLLRRAHSSARHGCRRSRHHRGQWQQSL